MDAVRFGRQVRALRRARAWRQVDLAERAHVSHALVSRVETGQAGGIPCRSLERVTTALGARLEVRVGWNGEELDRLLDERHAELVERMVRSLLGHGWLVAPEVSFNIRGERGSIDLLGFHPSAGAVLAGEVKSVVPDVQATLMVQDRKGRLAMTLAHERGWRATSVTRLLVVGRVAPPVAASRPTPRRSGSPTRFRAGPPGAGWPNRPFRRRPVPFCSCQVLMS